MAIVSDIEIRLRADIARLQQDMNSARRSVDTAMNGIAGAAKKALGILAGFGLGLGIGALVKEVVSAQREFDKLNAGLITATGSTENAAKAFAALQGFAATTPFSVQEATEAFVKLRNLGLTPSEAALRSYGNTASAMGKGLNQLIEAVADAATGEFERLKEFGIKSAVMGDQVAFTFKGTTKIIQNNAKDIEGYLKRLGEVDFAGAMERRAATLDGAISNLGDAWQSTLRAISSGGFGEGVQSGVIALSNALGDLGTILTAVGGKATEEGGKVKEAAGLHEALTAAFRTAAIAGVGLSAAIKDINTYFTTLKEVAKAKDLDGIKAALSTGADEAKKTDEWLKSKVAAIQGAVKAQADADAAQAKSDAANGTATKDRLAGYAVELSAEEKRNQAKIALIATEQRITGVNADSLADLKKLKTALDTGAITQERYNYLKGKLGEQMYSNSQAGKDETRNIEKSSAAVKQRADQQAILNDRYKDQLAFLHDTNQLNDTDFIVKSGAAEVKSLEDQKKAQEELLALAYRKHQNQVEQATLTGQIAATQAKIDSQEIKNAQDLQKEEHKLYLLAANNYADLLESAQDQTKSLIDTTREQKEETEALGLTAHQVAELTAKRLTDRAAILDQRAAVQDLADASGRLGDESRAQAEELRKQAAGGLYKEQLQETQAFYSKIEQAAHDTFTTIGDNGKSMWERLRDSGKSIFLEWLYSITVKKWIVQIGASVSGSSSVAGLASGSAGGSSAVGLISAGQKIYEGFSSGFAGTGTALGSAVSALGNIFGSSSVSAFGAGMGLTSSQAATAAAAYGEAGMGSVGSSLTAGSTAGAAAGVFAGVAGGLVGGKLISGGYGGNGAVNTGTAVGAVVGSIIPVIGTALGALVGGLLGGVYNRAFGYKDKEYSDNSTLAGTLSNDAFKGNLSTAYKQDGGWFRSDRSGTDTNAVSDTVSSSLTTAYSAITSTSAAYAKALGLSADSIATRTQALSVTLGKDDAANQKVLTDFFTGVSDTIASELLPNIAQFSAAGETASVTLQRLVVDFQAVDILMSTLGIDSNKAFGATGAAAIAAREDLIALAGGLDNLSAQMKFVSDNFITTAQKAAVAQTSVSTVMNAIGPALSTFGYSAIKTTDQYTNVVQGLASSGALATATGRQLYETLLALAPSFKLVTDEAANAKSAADQRASAAVDALGKAVDAQKNVFTNAYNAAMDALDARVTDLTDSISRMTALSSALKGSLSGVSAPGSAEASRASASAQINTALAIAKASGMLPSQDSIADALATLKSTSSDQFSSLADYQRSVAQSNMALEGLAGLTDSQVSAAQQQIDLLQQQKDQATAANTAQLAKLDNLVSAAQSQINAVNGINDSVLSVGQALLLVYEAANSLSGFSGIGATATPEGNNGGVGIFDMSAILLEMRTLNERIASMEASAAATAKSSGQFASQFNQVSGGGNSLLTVPA